MHANETRDRVSCTKELWGGVLRQSLGRGQGSQSLCVMSRADLILLEDVMLLRFGLSVPE
jgi:hypothetical protein